MEKNIFANAKFGDTFLTRDGRKAVLISKIGIYPINNTLIIENRFAWENYSDEGYRIISYDKDNNIIKDDNEDIVARYHEPKPIDEEELDELANNFNYHDKNDRYDDEEIGKYYGFQEGFKVGYCKAKEE